ncbi:hypothetical protein AgCh_012907 [Apium graveolens]
MSLNKYESIKIPILKKTEYPTWKVKMLMHLEATDPDYLSVINDGPFMPTKLVPATPTVAGHYQLKGKSEWTTEEKVVVMKDAKISDPAQQSVFGGKVNDKTSKEKSVGVARKKNNFPESDTDDSSSNPDDDTDSENDENMTDSDVMEMAALLVKGFRRMQFRKSKNNRSFRMKFIGGERKSTGRKDGKDSKVGKVDRIKIKCYNCDEPGHFASECKKIKHDKVKNKTLITSSKNWMDSSDSENEDICYELMASLDDPASFESKVQTPFFSFDNENISELKSILKSLHGNFKNKTLENDRLITEIETLKSRNEQLESDLINQIDLKKEFERAKHIVKILEARYSMLEKDLENERKTLKAWTDSGKKVYEIISKKNWKECLGYKDGVTDVDTENKITLKTPVKFISLEVDEPKSTFEKGSASVSQEKLVSNKSQRKENKETIKSVKKEKNIGLWSARQLKRKYLRRSEKMKTAIPDSDVRGHTLGYGNLIIVKVAIENVALVDGLKHYLLSISQITNRGYHVVFYDSHYEVLHNKSKKIVLIGYIHGNIYEARLHENLEKEATCLISRASVDESWNWHKKL